MLASENGDETSVKSLLNYGMNVNDKDKVRKKNG
jgi:hypothetical protein